MTKTTRKEKIYNEATREVTEESPAEVETTAPPTVRNGTVANCFSVNVRKWPSFESDVLEVLAKGDVVKILGKRKEFYKVSTNNTSIGYISSDFIKEG